MTKKIETVTENRSEVFVPLNKLKKSPRNARKMPHSDAAIEALAASIEAKGMLQNLVVEPEWDEEGVETGFYFVTVGEGRRLAHLLRANRKQIKKNEPIRCVLDAANDPHEISLDENVTRSDMHPADQFEAFRRLSEENGWGAEEIAARFGVTPHVVRQRLRLGAVSPKLMQVYREGALTLDQLMAFAISEDHERQEQVYGNLSWNKEPSVIRRMMTETHVRASDRRAVFVGADAYIAAGGAVLRDLFSEDDGGYFADAGLLDRLAVEKLETVATEVQTEGWKWVQAFIDYPHAHGLRRIYRQPVPLSPEDQAELDAVQAEYDALSEQYDSAEELPDDVDAKFGELEAGIDRLSERQRAYDADDIAHGGVFVVLNHDGTARIERGFIRPEDEKQPDRAPETESNGEIVTGDHEGIEGEAAVSPKTEQEDTEDDNGKPLSDLLIRDLSAHRTLALRIAVGESPDIALVAVTHALVAQTFYRGYDTGACLDITPASTPLGGHADGIEDTAAARKLAERHETWAVQMPKDAADLWTFVVGLDHDSRMALFAHCTSLTVFAVRQPWDRKPRAWATADGLAGALALDMTAHWAPTVRSYFGRVTKAHILEAVQEAVGEEAAHRLRGMKKQAMAEAAEQLLAGTGWLPALLRTSGPDIGTQTHESAVAAE
ncbi:ParB/RepB/Spo0J family partition protein [Dongia deserti]|uniref:ParB/RepB/Spo0J family partition protein n=1 Tax=Dongia deserti TaxID=2268030 RepID=UPI000E659D48|nr:ParB/RepB/Spo0J family partition protein [Dongia deserti]